MLYLAHGIFATSSNARFQDCAWPSLPNTLLLEPTILDTALLMQSMSAPPLLPRAQGLSKGRCLPPGHWGSGPWLGGWRRLSLW